MTFNGNDFTERMRLVLARAREQAARLGARYVLPEHMALGLLDEEQSVGCVLLVNLGANVQMLRQSIEMQLTARPRVDEGGASDMPYSADAMHVLQLAMAEAGDLRDGHVGTEHILLGILREGQSGAATVLTAHDLTSARVRAEVARVRAIRPIESIPQFPVYSFVFKALMATRRSRAAERVAVIALIVSLVALALVLTRR